MRNSPVSLNRAAPGRQRGAVAVFAAIFIVATVTAVGLVIEVGRMYSAQSELQKVANIAAIDSARVIGGCRDADPDEAKTVAQLQDEAEAAIDAAIANNFPNRTADEIPTATQVKLGVQDPDSGTLRNVVEPGETRPSAVQVTLTDNNFTTLTNLFDDTPGQLTASSAATSQPTASIQVGSRLAGIDPTVLNDLLGIDVGAAQDGDLADAGVTLGELADVEAGVVTREQLLDTSVNDALGNLSDNVSNVASTLIGGLANLYAGLTDPSGDEFNLADLLNIAGPVGSDLRVNAGNILNAAAQLAATQRGDSIELDLDLTSLAPSIADVTAEVRLLEPPQRDTGPAGIKDGGVVLGNVNEKKYFTEANNSQAAIVLNVLLADLDVSIGGFGLVTLKLAEIPIIIRGAVSEAGISEIECAQPSTPAHTVFMEGATDLVQIDIARLEDTDNDGDLDVVPDTIDILDEATLLGFPVLSGAAIEISGSGSASTAGAADPIEFDDLRVIDTTANNADLPECHHISNDADCSAGEPLSTQQLLDNLLSNLNLNVQLVGLSIPLSTILNPLNNLLGALAPILAPVLDPVFEGLGVSLGSGDVTLEDLKIDNSKLIAAEDAVVQNGNN